MNPVITIIIPSYNVEQYLTDACESVLGQTYIYWEALIIDDGSSDNTAIIANSFCNKDQRFKYIHQENKGLSFARKTGIDAAKGEFIQFLDADDTLLPKRLEIMLDAVKAVEENIILYSDYIIGIDNSVTGRVTQSDIPIKLDNDITFNEMYVGFGNAFGFNPACILFRKSVFQYIKYDETLRSAEDWDLYLSFCSSGFKFRNISQVLVIYRHNPSGLSSNRDKMFYYSSIVTLKWKDEYKLSKYYYIRRITSSLISYRGSSLKHRNKINYKQIYTELSGKEKALFNFYVIYYFIHNCLIPNILKRVQFNYSKTRSLLMGK